MKFHGPITKDHLKLLNIFHEHDVQIAYLDIIDGILNASPCSRSDEEIIEIANMSWVVYLKAPFTVSLDSLVMDITHNYDEIKKNCTDVAGILKLFVEED